MKKAMTLTEVMIALTIIAVVAAISIPVLNNARPDKDKVFFKKAVMTVSQAFDLTTDTTPILSFDTYWKNNTNISNDYLCKTMASNINTSGAINCTSAGSYDSPNFISTDGLRFWGFYGSFTADTKTVYVDRKLSDSEKTNLSKRRDSSHSSPGLKIILNYDGGAFLDKTAAFNYENKLVEDSESIAK